MITPGGTTWDWDKFDLDTWLKHLGEQLERKQASGETVEWETVYDVASATVGQPGADADSLVDTTHDALYDRQEIIVWYRFEGTYWSFASIALVDFDSEKLFVFQIQEEELGEPRTLVGIVGRNDTEGIVKAAGHLLEDESIPDRIEVEPPITRAHIKTAFKNKLHPFDWDRLAIVVSGEGEELPFATEAERETLLEVYLKQALDE